LLAHHVEDKTKPLGIEFDRIQLAHIVREYARGLLGAVLTFRLGRQLPIGEVFQQQREMGLQPGESLGSRVRNVALEGIRIEFARRMKLADLIKT
jgi:hypothetical protein